MPKVLLADKLPKSTVDMLKKAGLEVVEKPGLTQQELPEAIRDVQGLIVRSSVQVTADVLEAAQNLQAICRAGIGVDNIDLEAATRKGVAVMNTPGANAISTAEHTFALILALSRNIGPAYISMRGGKWDRKKFVGVELAGTTLGIIGLGRVGQAVAERANAFGMKVLAFDPFISSEMASKLGVELADELADILKRADYITIHVPGSDQTRDLIGEKEVGMMKPNARIINCARGEVIDMNAVVRAVKDGRLGGAAFDVYTEEPPPDFGFARDDRILATPHLGASTEAAQLAVGEQAAEQMVDALVRGHYRNAVNMIAVSPEEMEVLRPYCELACHIGRMAGALSRGRPKSLEITCKGELAEHNTAPIVNYGVMGLLQSVLGEAVNIVSAPHLAEERGLHVTISSTMALEAGFTDLILLKLVTDAGDCEVAGTVFGRRHKRIVRIGPFYTEIVPEGHMLLVFCKDRPGAIGQVGGALGKVGVNIARMTFSRAEAGGDALLALNLDGTADEETCRKIRSLPIVERVVRFSF